MNDNEFVGSLEMVKVRWRPNPWGGESLRESRVPLKDFIHAYVRNEVDKLVNHNGSVTIFGVYSFQGLRLTLPLNNSSSSLKFRSDIKALINEAEQVYLQEKEEEKAYIDRYTWE